MAETPRHSTPFTPTTARRWPIPRVSGWPSRQASTISTAQSTASTISATRTARSTRWSAARVIANPWSASTATTVATSTATTTSQVRKATSPSRRLPASSWADPGTTRVITISDRARRNRTRAARSSAVDRGRTGRAVGRTVLGEDSTSAVSPVTRVPAVPTRRAGAGGGRRGSVARMPERPPPPGPRGGSEEGSDFGWIYGDRPPADPDATRAVPQQPRPGGRPPADDRTRVIPQQPRPGGPGGPGGPVRPAPAPAGPAGRAPAKRRWRPRPRHLLLLVLAWIVFLVAVPIYAWSQVDEVDFEPGDGGRPDEQPGTTYLMVGSDSRGDLTEEERRLLGTGDAQGERTDSILVLHTGSGPNLLMSIPRDSIVEVPGAGTTKINAAFALGGPELLTQTVENETGIRIDHYVEIGFGGFVDLVDAVGGVEICPREAMTDPLAKLDVEKGCQEADGPTALGYARSRKVSALGDIDRARRQREVVSAIGSAAISPWTVLNPWRYWRLNTAGAQSVAVGEGMGPVRAAMWASAMTNVDGDGGLTCGVPIADLAVNWDPDRAPQMFEAIIEDDTESITEELCSPTGGVPQ